MAPTWPGALLDLRDRLVGMSGIGNEPLTLAVHEQVELLEHGLADQHLVAEHQGFFERVSPLQLDDQRFRHVHGFPASIRVLGDPLASRPETEPEGDVRRQNHANGSGVDESVGLVGSHLFGLEHAPSGERLVDSVRQLGLDPNLTHAWHRRNPRSWWQRPIHDTSDPIVPSVLHTWRSFGSRRSRTQSPRMFSERTVTRMAMPGRIEIHHACSISPRPSATMTPHDGVGGGIPTPRNESAASSTMT